MSRFSKNTARTIGYALFAAAGATAYLSAKVGDPAGPNTIGPESTIVAQTAPLSHDSMPLPLALGPNADYATELSAVMTPMRYDDPIVDLGFNKRPAWATDEHFAGLDRLARQNATLVGREANVPQQYPHTKVEPMAIPRAGNAVVHGLATPPTMALPPLGPPAITASEIMRSQGLATNNSQYSSGNMVPIQRDSYAARQTITAAKMEALAKAEKEPASWPDRGMVVLRELGRGIFTDLDKSESTDAEKSLPSTSTSTNQLVGSVRDHRQFAGFKDDGSISTGFRPIAPPTLSGSEHLFIRQPTN